MIELEQMLRAMVDRGASDLFLKAGQRPFLRVDGQMTPADAPALSADDVADLARRSMNERQAEEFEAQLEMDLSLDVGDMGRFRVNLFRQRGATGLVFRHIPKPHESFEELNLPPVVRRLAEKRRGLVLVTGTTGSGKSTTLAAMVNHINKTRACHIVTIEDPIEFVFEDDQAVVDQREVGFDTHGFREALRRVMRQSPDVIFIGEMRDVETVETAISAAETGHLVLSTLHTIDAPQTVERIVNFFPAHMHAQIRMELGLVLEGVISQRLLRLEEERGRIPAIEAMVSTPTIRKLLHEGRTVELSDRIAEGGEDGMTTFNQSLVRLYHAGKVSRDEAMAFATSPDELRLALDGITTGTQSTSEFMGKAD